MLVSKVMAASAIEAAFFAVRPAGRVARKRNLTGCGGQSGDVEVQVLYWHGKGNS